jgi:hypothetical protein
MNSRSYKLYHNFKSIVTKALTDKEHPIEEKVMYQIQVFFFIFYNKKL